MKKYQKPCTKKEEVIDKGKWSKSLNENKAGLNHKNPPILLKINAMQKKVSSSDKLQDLAYE